MYKFVISGLLIITLTMIMSCSNMKRNYWKENNCRNKIERHYNDKGKYTGNTWETVCD